MTQVTFKLRLKLFDIKNIKVFLLYNNIENNEKTLHLLSATTILSLPLLFVFPSGFDS
jgi:hypothetical protein